MISLGGADDLFSIVLAVFKDKAYMETAKKMQVAFHELILAEADARRDKTTTLICARAKFESEIIRFKKVYNHISEQLTPEAKATIDRWLKMLEQKKKDLIHEKDGLKRRSECLKSYAFRSSNGLIMERELEDRYEEL